VTATRLAYQVDGPDDAPVVVLGGSLGTTRSMWEPQLPTLTERFRVVRYDHVGHGESAAPEGSCTIDVLGRELVMVLDAMRVPTVSYVGLSLGGMVGLWLASNAPDRIRRLAVVCTSARLGPSTTWTDRAAEVRARGMRSVADTVLARWFTPGFAATQPEVVATYRAMLLSTPVEGYAACCEVIAALDLRATLASVLAPTLVVAGADDPATPVHHSEAIASALPHARLAVVPEAAHLANVERPDEVARLLLEHLTEE
jgi:3-oxoadipate enol-lactonase